jgi:cell division transport system permease protein
VRPASLRHFVREAATSIRDNALMSLASASTVAISLLVLALFVVLALNLQHMGQVLDAQVEIVAYLRTDFDRANQPLLMQKIEAIPGVVAATFVTKEQALDRLRQQFGDQQDLLDAVAADNPLPDSVEIRVARPDQVAAVAAAVGQLQSVERADYKQAVVQRLFALTAALRTAGLVLVAGLALATVILIANSVRLAVFARREEIAIMKLVGATDSFIRWPFVLEGALLGVIGGAAAAAVVWWGYSALVARIARDLPFLPVLPRQPLLSNLTAALVLLGLGLGAAGSGVSLRRFLRV